MQFEHPYTPTPLNNIQVIANTKGFVESHLKKMFKAIWACNKSKIPSQKQHIICVIYSMYMTVIQIKNNDQMKTYVQNNF